MHSTLVLDEDLANRVWCGGERCDVLLNGTLSIYYYWGKYCVIDNRILIVIRVYKSKKYRFLCFLALTIHLFLKTTCKVAIEIPIDSLDLYLLRRSYMNKNFQIMSMISNKNDLLKFVMEYSLSF